MNISSVYCHSSGNRTNLSLCSQRTHSFPHCMQHYIALQVSSLTERPSILPVTRSHQTHPIHPLTHPLTLGHRQSTSHSYTPPPKTTQVPSQTNTDSDLQPVRLCQSDNHTQPPTAIQPTTPAAIQPTTHNQSANHTHPPTASQPPTARQTARCSHPLSFSEPVIQPATAI